MIPESMVKPSDTYKLSTVEKFYECEKKFMNKNKNYY